MKNDSLDMKRKDMYCLLEKGIYGMLSMSSTDNKPYAVPMFYVYTGNSIYIHTGLEGKKNRFMKDNNLVSFCVVGDVHIDRHKCTACYESVIAFGKVHEIHGLEKEKALEAFVEKYGANESCGNNGCSGEECKCNCSSDKSDYKKCGEVTKVYRINVMDLTGRKC